MTERELYIGKWHADFLFSDGDYDEELVLTRLYDMDASYHVMREVNNFMKECDANCGFTFTNSDLHKALVVIGPADSGKQFINTLVHEVHHLAVAVAESLGIDLDKETPAYISGDLALSFADVICKKGCAHCNS